MLHLAGNSGYSPKRRTEKIAVGEARSFRHPFSADCTSGPASRLGLVVALAQFEPGLRDLARRRIHMDALRREDEDVASFISLTSQKLPEFLQRDWLGTLQRISALNLDLCRHASSELRAVASAKTNTSAAQADKCSRERMLRTCPCRRGVAHSGTESALALTTRVDTMNEDSGYSSMPRRAAKTSTRVKSALALSELKKIFRHFCDKTS
jgi:hypothetical protein